MYKEVVKKNQEIGDKIDYDKSCYEYCFADDDDLEQDDNNSMDRTINNRIFGNTEIDHNKTEFLNTKFCTLAGGSTRDKTVTGLMYTTDKKDSHYIDETSTKKGGFLLANSNVTEEIIGKTYEVPNSKRPDSHRTVNSDSKNAKLTLRDRESEHNMMISGDFNSDSKRSNPITKMLDEQTGQKFDLSIKPVYDFTLSANQPIQKQDNPEIYIIGNGLLELTVEYDCIENRTGVVAGNVLPTSQDLKKLNFSPKFPSGSNKDECLIVENPGLQDIDEYLKDELELDYDADDDYESKSGTNQSKTNQNCNNQNGEMIIYSNQLQQENEYNMTSDLEESQNRVASKYQQNGDGNAIEIKKFTKPKEQPKSFWFSKNEEAAL